MILLSYLWGVVWLCAASWMMRPFLSLWLDDLPAEERTWVTPPLVFGVSIGVLTLLLFIIGFWKFNTWVALSVPIFFIGVGVFKNWRFCNGVEFSLKSVIRKIWQGDLLTWVLIASLIAFIVVLGQATYYPFIGDDEISRYAYYGKLLWWRGQATTDIRGYPMLMPTIYAYIFSLTNYIYISTGQLAEQLARVIPVLFSVATVFATTALGRRWFGRSGGVIAGLMLIITSLYLHWSADGYVDIPSALYFVLGAYAADVWLEKRSLPWAMMMGVATGLSLWTKQSGFAMLATLGLVFLWALLKNFRDIKKIVRDGFLVLLVAFIFGGWWYVRNAYYDGVVNALPTPGTLYTQQASATLWNVIPFISSYSDFGAIASTLYIIGLIWAVLRVRRSSVVWSLLWGIPYTLLWWLTFSYDARFMLTVLPFYAILVGGCVEELSGWWGMRGGIPLKWSVIIAIFIGVAVSLRDANLGGARQWFVAPAASYSERLIRAKGDLYPTVEFIRAYVPRDAKIISMDGRFSYYLADRNVYVNYPYDEKSLAEYDYLVLGSWWNLTYPLVGMSDREMLNIVDDRRVLQRVFTGPTNSLIIYRVVKP